VVVGPESSRPAAGSAAGSAAGDVLWTLEDPPLGGPVAGVAAALAALERAAAAETPSGTETAARPADWVLLLACDLPWAADAARILLAAADAGAAADAVDGIHLVDADGRAQWLTGLYRASALAEAVRLTGVEVRGASMRGLLGGLTLRGIRDESNAGRDVDTWQDVAETEAILNPPPVCG
ncbi:NTP transferase domain-containing protein, partial [Cryobacterium tagatosivorans]